MPMSTAHRKLLWARSVGCCAICKHRLTQDETSADLAVVIGEEAHIVSEQVGGPRYRPMEPGEVDDYANLILLCPNHHRQVDKQEGHFTESKLKEIKAAHERWAKERQQTQPQVRLRDLAPGTPVALQHVRSGPELARVVGHSQALHYSKPDDLTDGEVELVAVFLQSITDYMDLWSDLGSGDKIRAELDFRRSLDELRNAGLIVLGGTREQILEGGVGSPLRWRTGVLGVRREAEIQTPDMPPPDTP